MSTDSRCTVAICGSDHTVALSVQPIDITYRDPQAKSYCSRCLPGPLVAAVSNFIYLYSGLFFFKHIKNLLVAFSDSLSF